MCYFNQVIIGFEFKKCSILLVLFFPASAEADFG